MSAPEATPELLAAITPAEKRPPQLIVTIREAWRYGRTKVGVIIFVFMVGLALLGRFSRPTRRRRSSARPLPAPLPRPGWAPTTSATTSSPASSGAGGR